MSLAEYGLMKLPIRYLPSTLLAIELVVLILYAFFHPVRPEFGFLVKRSDGYLVAWKTDRSNEAYRTRWYRSLPAALSFAQDELRLTTGQNPLWDEDLERLWVRDRRDAYVLYWKRLQQTDLRQMVFNRQADLVFFVDALQKGAYSPSPFGDSLFMRPAR